MFDYIGVSSVGLSGGASRPHRARLLSSDSVVSEPISPELVLVDPELARRERARLEERARLAEYRARYEARAAAAAEVPVAYGKRLETSRRLAQFGRRKLVPAALLGSLLVNGFFAAEFVARVDKNDGTTVVQVAARPSIVTETIAPSSIANPAVSMRSPRRHLTNKAVVEQKLVALILSAPARKLPRAFVDPTTGLVKSNVRVVCRRAAARSYRCAVRLPPGGAKGHLAVAYRVAHGKAQFKWYGYRAD
jgi:hypothetical protein